MIVLETSALVEFLVGADPLAEKVRVVATGERLAAPHAVDLECASAFHGLMQVRNSRQTREDVHFNC